MSAILFDVAAQPTAQVPAHSEQDMAAAVAQVAELFPHAATEARLSLAALLEMRGITDNVAISQGAGSVFDLAEQLLSTPPTAMPAKPTPAATPGDTWWRHLALGPIQALVMAITLGLLDLSERSLRAVGVAPASILLATITATVVVGGSLQLSAWLLAVAEGRGQARGMRAALWQGARVGAIAELSVTLALLGGGLARGAEITQLLAIAAVGPLTAALLLASGALLLLKRRGETILVLAGTLALSAAGSALWAGAGALTAIGLTTIGAAVGMAALAGREIRRRGQALNCDRLSLPHGGLVAHQIAPLALYGSLSIILVFAGQLPGWLAADPPGVISAFTRTQMLGLGVLVLAQGAFEAAMHALWGEAIAIRRQLALSEAGAVGARLRAFIGAASRQALRIQSAIALTLAAAALLSGLLAAAPAAVAGLAASLIGYASLGQALFLCGVLNSMGARWPVVRAIAAAITVSGVFATLGARWWGAPGASLGLLVGSGLLLALAVGELRSLLREGDSTLYCAF